MDLPQAVSRKGGGISMKKGMEDILDSMRGNGSDWLCVLCDRQGAGCYDRYDRRTLSAWHRGVFPQLYGG